MVLSRYCKIMEGTTTVYTKKENGKKAVIRMSKMICLTFPQYSKNPSYTICHPLPEETKLMQTQAA